MAASAYSGFNPRVTSQRAPAAPEQVKNNAGGYVFEISPLERAKRFLILGSDKNTYYEKAAELTEANGRALVDIAQDPTLGRELVDLIVDISQRGIAPKQTPGIFALALVSVHGEASVKQYALTKLCDVARTGSTLFEFAKYREQLGGWGRGARRAVADWYLSRTVDSMAFQMVKYRSRSGKTHRQMLRVSHPKTADPARKAVFDWAIRDTLDDSLPDVIRAFEVAKTSESPAHWATLVRKYGLTWEMLPDEALSHRVVNEALLEHMPLGALIRQLPKLTNLGIIAPFGGGETRRIVARLTDARELGKARIHPIKVLMALKTYAAGRGMRSTWTPVQDVVDALDRAFYLSFGAIEPAGKRTLVGVDVSGSMGSIAWGEQTLGYGYDRLGPTLQAREIAAAIALVTKATEPHSDVFGFSGGFIDLGISPRMRLDDVLRKMAGLPFDRTDCAVPIVKAIQMGWEVDTFVIITDNETWSGSIHPFQALQQYRRVTGIPAKLAVLATTSTGFSIADPSDAGMLDLVGFGADVPQLLTEFSRGF